MTIKQLSVFVENKQGRLSEITGILQGAGVDIRALSLADTTDFGILRLIVDKEDVAEAALRGAGLTVSLTPVIAAGIADRPGGLAEAMALLRRTKEGDQEARRQLIEGNLRLVLSVIQRFSSRGENVDDLFQVGCVGLIKAIDNFDINQPVKFSTYGVPMIIGEIRRYLRDNSAIRVSRSMRDTAYKVLQVRERLLNETQREPTVEQIAKELDIPREDVVFAMDAIVDPVSLYEPVYSDGGDALCVMDQVRDTQNTDERWTDRIALKDALRRLDDRERRILSLRFYEGKTQMEVSAEVGISQAQVSRLEKGAINTIKKNI